MAERNNRTRRERMKYGMCLNDECQKCKTKEIIQIPMRRDFVCPDCGKELRECPPPKKKSNLIIIAVVIILFILACIICGIMYSGSEDEKTINHDTIPADTTIAVPVVSDSLETRSDTLVSTTESSDKQISGSKVIETTVTSKVTTIRSNTTSRSKSTGNSGRSTLNLSYGKYVGEVKNGYPHGMGRLTYTKTRQINRHDQKARQASVGDYVIGEFVNGFFVQGKHYNSEGELLGSIIVGVAADNAFESK